MTIRVDGVEITEREIERERQLQLRHQPSSAVHAARAARGEAERALVVKQLLLGEARRRSLPGAALDATAGAQEQAVRALTEQAVGVPQVSEAECVAFFEANRDRFRGPDLFEPSHILFAAPPDSAEARVEALTAARETLASLRRDPERFERIARERSACPSGENGGSLGQITRGETEPAFERHMLELEVGEISREPIETDHGFHILRLDHRARGDLLPYEVVADRVRIYLRDRAWRGRVHAFIADLAARSTIEGVAL